MRIHLELLGDEGLVLKGETFESPLVTAGSDPGRDDFVIDALPTRLQISVDGAQVVVKPFHGDPSAIREATTFVIGAIRLRVTPYPHLRAAGRAGDCPRCSVPLRDSAIGAAYRTMARRERACDVCGGAILDLEATDAAIGAFVDTSVNDWVHVAAPVRCPGCREAMTRATFSTARGPLQVERCAPCGLVFVGADDRDRLAGGPI